MRNNILHILKELGFIILTVEDTHICNLTKNEYLKYEVIVLENISNFVKTHNDKVAFLCSSTTDFEYVYNTICKEFIHELRQIKINKLL